MEILFVCTGNTCRSPMAAGIFYKQAKEKDLTGYTGGSAGLCAETGQPAAENAVTACAEIGVDLSAHNARILDNARAEKTDLFVVMTKDHTALLKNAGIPGEKIRILGEGIPDPYGGSLDVYRVCRDRIADGVARLIDDLSNGTGQEKPTTGDLTTGTGPEKTPTGGLTIVPLSAPHIPALADIEILCFSDPWSAQSLAVELENPAALFFVALRGNQPVGYIGLHHILGEGYMTNIAVHPDYRRQGIARRLIERLLAEARQKKLSFVTLEVRFSNETAITLYETLGFTRTGTRRNYYRHPTEDALLMTMDLDGKSGGISENNPSDEERKSGNRDEDFEH